MVFFHIAPLLEGRKENIGNFIVTLREWSEKKGFSPVSQNPSENAFIVRCGGNPWQIYELLISRSFAFTAE
jgi:hypothetical protein